VALACWKHGLGILVDLPGRFPIMIVYPGILVLAVLGGVIPAYPGSGFVLAAKVVVAKVLASGMHQQVPGFILDKYGGSLVQEVPTDELEVFPVLGRVDGQGEVATALGRATGAKVIALFGIHAGRFAGINDGRGHGSLVSGTTNIQHREKLLISITE